MRAFPVIYTHDVNRLVSFYESLGFAVQYGFPPDDPGYVGLSRGTSDLGIVTVDSPRELIGIDVGEGPRFEMFIYVDDLDATVNGLREAGTPVLKEPADMPWGERLAYVTDPDGNPVALALGNA
jgi:lactoylglutathione lyase